MKELGGSGHDVRRVEKTGLSRAADTASPLQPIEGPPKHGVSPEIIIYADTRRPGPGTPHKDDLNSEGKESRKRGRKVGSTDISIQQRRQSLREKLVPGAGLTTNDVAAEHNVTPGQIRFDLDRMLREDIQNHLDEVRHANPDADPLETELSWLEQKREPFKEASRAHFRRVGELEAEGKRTGRYDSEGIKEAKEARERARTNPMRLAIERAMDRVCTRMDQRYYDSKK